MRTRDVLRALRGGGCLLAGALLTVQPGSTGISRSVDQIKGASERPLPSPPSRPVERGTSVWVPDRFVPFPFERGGVFVPGHWELGVGDGRVMVPPVTVERPDAGTVQTLPGGVRALDGPQAP